MNFLSPDKLLNIVQHNDNLLDPSFPLAVDTLWKELSLAITSLNLSKECIELYYETMQAFSKETSPLHLGTIISDELLMFTSSHRDIDKLINKQSPLVPSDVLLLFAINKLYEGVQANNNEQLWQCFGEASEAYALAKITEAVSDTLLFHEEFLDQIPESLVSQWHAMKESRKNGGHKGAEAIAKKQAPYFDEAERLAKHIWSMHSYLSSGKLATLIKDHFERVYVNMLGLDVIPKQERISSHIKQFAPKETPLRMNKGTEHYKLYIKNEQQIIVQITEFYEGLNPAN